MKSLLTFFSLLLVLLFTANAQATTTAPVKTDDPVVVTVTKTKVNTTNLNEGEYVRLLNASKTQEVAAPAPSLENPTTDKEPSKREMRRLMRLMSKMEQEEIPYPRGTSIPLKERE